VYSKISFLVFFIFNFIFANATIPVSNIGHEFWAGIGNRSTTSNYKFYIIANANSDVVFNSKDTSFTKQVLAGVITEVILNAGQFSTINSSTPQDRGIQILCSNPIAVYVAGEREAFSDATYLLPKEFIGPFPTYIFNRYSQTFNNNSLIFVAMEDSTEIVFTNQPAGYPPSVFLNKFETFGMPYLLSGATITARCGLYCQPFAVFFHNSSTEIGGCGALEPLYNQVLPESKQGNTFVLTPMIQQSAGYAYSILAYEDNTVVTLNDNPPIFLNRGARFEAIGTSDSIICVQANKPVSVFQLLLGRECQASRLGDPALVELIDFENMITQATFRTITGFGLIAHYVNIVVEQTAIADLRINGLPVNPANFMERTACGKFRVYRSLITPGTHTISCNRGFVAYAYGYGNGESYLFNLGTKGVSNHYDFNLTRQGVCPGDTVFVEQIGDPLNNVRYTANGVVKTGTSSFFVFNESGEYSIILRANPPGQACLMRIEKKIKVEGPPTAFQNDTAICGNFNIVANLPINQLREFVWSDPSNTNDFMIIDSGGMYWVRMTDTFGCVYTDSFEVLQAVLPTLEYDFSALLCDGNSFYFKNLKFEDGITYTLRFFEIDSVLVDSTILSAFPDTGTFNIKFWGMLADACGDSISFDVSNIPVPIAGFNVNPLNACLRGNLFEFTNQSIDFNYSLDYRWQIAGEPELNDFEFNKSFAIEGLYPVKLWVENEFGCEDSTELVVEVFPQTNLEMFADSVCLGKPSNFRANTFLSFGNIVNFEWDFGDGNSASGPNQVVAHTYSSPGDFFASVISETDKGCKDTIIGLQPARVWTLPKADFNFSRIKDSLNISGFQFRDSSFGNLPFEYFWTFDRFGNSSEVNPYFEFSDTGTMRILLKVLDINGCEDEIEKSFVTYPKSDWFFPSGFSPNGDFINDIYKPTGVGFYQSFSIEIYNRWGALMFKADNPDIGWDGKYQNEDVAEGTFIFVAKIEMMDGRTILKRGTLNLLR
jgi:gliding motility-associated-like protein